VPRRGANAKAGAAGSLTALARTARLGVLRAAGPQEKAVKPTTQRGEAEEREMATTPKRSLKRTLASSVEERSPRFLLGSLALAMVISLVAGLAIGVTVEQHRHTSKKAKTAVVKKKNKPTAVQKFVPNAVRSNAPPTAIVVRHAPSLLTLSPGQGQFSVALVKGTRVEIAKPAPRSDIVVGSRVLTVFKPKTSQGITAVSEILIVTGTGKGIGSVVTAVTPTSMTLKKAWGVFSTVGAKIEKTVLGGQANIAKGRRVIVRMIRPAPIRQGKRLIKQLPVALEVVVLSPRSAFR
jgi:hypothetical protein